MGRLDRFYTWLTEPLEQRTTVDILDPNVYYPDIDTQLYAKQRQQAGQTPQISIREAMGIPAIFRAISLLATTAASLQLKEYRNGQEIDPAPVVKRPQKEWTFGSFMRDSVQYMASRGEAIWLVLERDFQGFPSNLLPVLPEAMKSEWDGIRHTWWSEVDGVKTTYARENVIHIPFLRDGSTGRGVGPMQSCGLALNVAREADVWASRFFLGSIPSIYLDSEMPINAAEVDVIKERWLSDPPNIPKVGHGFKPTQLNINPESAQLTGSRMHSRGDVALLFGIPGKLLEYTESGSSITYANVGDLATELVRLTLAPIYLEQIEQAFSDLRPRGTEVRFDVSGLERADVKTRFEVHEKAIATGVYDAQYAQTLEGISGESAQVIPTELRQVS